MLTIDNDGNDKIALIFKKDEDANDLIDNISKFHPDWRATIPSFKRFRVGVLLGVNTEFSEEQLKKGLAVFKSKVGDDKVEPTQVVRIKKRSRIHKEKI